MGTGTIELKKFKEQSAVDPGYRRKLDDFVEAITPGKPISKPHEKMMSQHRWLTLLGLYNVFSELMIGYGNLVNWRDRKAILERIEELEREANFCNNSISDREDLPDKIRDLVKKHVPEADLKRFQEEQRKEIK
ncbi:MAG: hypothetical protein QMD77_02950 [Patescibacteria group bacterium]|nr:hypothetical protein [Patescibacteria group bacterium]